ncbi:hypothetical protein DV451_000423 [Geotrichum candidum]|uniref:Protein-serine/threonine kinase n=1 Tax=Geotrichum candidum TaxID=1173061 RepID=A0A9P5KWR4_GEOCN|nr:hypothetical protein DV451_000423 [Geotrichum candidum]KAF5107218.1 hypothetical protein DV453_003280 [Geotrichum candidum]
MNRLKLHSVPLRCRSITTALAHPQRNRHYSSDFAHHAEPGSFATTLKSKTYPPGSKLINSRHFYQNTVLLDWVQKRKPRPVSLRQLAFFGRKLTAEKLVSSGDFVQQELPTRLAHRIREMQELPFGVSIDSDKLDKFMSSILCSRISRRVIAEQHLSLTANYKNGTYNDGSSKDDPNYIGAVFLRCNAKEAVEASAVQASMLIQQLYPDARMPEIIIEGLTDTNFLYMKSHLDYILGEILRNSIEATVRHHEKTKGAADSPPPPILVSISNTAKTILIRISDQGGGIPSDILPHIWSFSKGPRSQYRLDNFKQVPTYAGISEEISTPVSGSGNHITSETTDFRGFEQFLHQAPTAATGNGSGLSSLASLSSRPPDLKLGMGLPLSRIYADYWDGHLDLHSLEGYGVDVFLRISRLGNQNEKLQLDKV